MTLNFRTVALLLLYSVWRRQSAQAGVSPGLRCPLSSSTGNLTDSRGHGCSPGRIQAQMLPIMGASCLLGTGARRGLLDLQQAQHNAWQSEDRVEPWGGEVTADPL